MTTTCQTILERARAINPLNPSINVTRTEILARIRAEQQEVFTRTAAVQHDRFVTSAGLLSTNAASDRVVDLSVLAGSPLFQPVERILEVRFASSSGTPLNHPDITDVDGEYPPRYVVEGETLLEVGDDWGATGEKLVWVRYVYGAVPIDPDGAYTQVVTVPDAWTDLIEIPLERYLFEKDPGRDPAEDARLSELLGSWEKETGRRGAYLSYLRNYGGAAIGRFLIPTPAERGRQ